MKISIVMAYHNRRQLLINTLRSIWYYNHGKDDYEVIIVDDGSDIDERIDDLPGIFTGMKLFTMYLDKSRKHYVNPCIPYNIAFGFATGDVILYQNTECLHVGDVLGVVRNISSKNTHISFSLYSVNSFLQNKLQHYIDNTGVDGEVIKRALRPMVGHREVWTDGDTCWYNHSRHRRAFGSFIWSMTRADLDDMRGFDERYSQGFAWDDAEFTVRLERKRMLVRYSDEPFAVHQWHVPSNYTKMARQAQINRDLFHNVTMKEKGYRAPKNRFYIVKA